MAGHISCHAKTWQINLLLRNIFKKELTQNYTGPSKPSCPCMFSLAFPCFILTMYSGCDIGGKEG